MNIENIEKLAYELDIPVKELTHKITSGKPITTRSLAITRAMGITELPDNLTVNGTLNITMSGLTKLPENLMATSLWLNGTSIEELPLSLEVTNMLYITKEYDDDERPKTVVIPEGFTISGGLNFCSTGAVPLPANLTVRTLIIHNCLDTTTLPENLTVNGSIYMDGTPIVALPNSLSTECLGIDVYSDDHGKFSAYRENCGKWDRTIFAVMMQGNYYISAGCFFDTLAEFCSAVHKNYDGSDARDYIGKAVECVEELKLKQQLMAEKVRCGGVVCAFTTNNGKFKVCFDVVADGILVTAEFDKPASFSGSVRERGDTGFVLPFTEEFTRSTICGTTSKYFEEINGEIIEGYLIPNELI